MTAMLRTRKTLLTALAALVLLLGAGLYAVAQQAMDESKRERALAVPGGTYYVLPATLDTTQWGWLDPKEPPKLTIASGDSVSIETLMHSRDAVQPGKTIDDLVKLRLANPGGGPHSITGPVSVEGAAPGDVLEVRIRKIVPKDVGTNF